jgi:2-polyprenyl-3-methyl-5-hydroxy-6-metoxy-1,4-benzoquinol methylase
MSVERGFDAFLRPRPVMPSSAASWRTELARLVVAAQRRACGLLLRLGSDAWTVLATSDGAERESGEGPGRCVRGSAGSLPFDAGRFTTVILEGCNGDRSDLVAIAREVCRVAARFVLVRLTPDAAGGPTGRERVERVWFAEGFRKHACYYDVSPYESLNRESPGEVIAFERVPDAAAARYPLRVLEARRLLHMDMLREPGRRSDAHCYRYHVAAEFVRPGDIVLDIACGYGYGSHLLFARSRAARVIGADVDGDSIEYARAHYARDGVVEFREGDAQALDWLPDNSVDFVASFETIEHLADPESFLREVRRVLRPAGRAMFSAPDRWVDETGRDPNPHHQQIYTWDRLLEECRRYFLVEKGFAQTAGGAMKLHHAGRSWREVPVDVPLATETEWVLTLCMKDPLPCRDVPYVETLFPIPSTADFHVSAFARDYLNPWLVRGMVAIGVRNTSRANLRSMQTRVFESAPHESVDRGAALCGLVYDRLAIPWANPSEEDALLAEVHRYAALPSPTPHQLRWQVSLLFAGAELARARGRLDEARALYEVCAERDVAGYSPLLGNRILDARFWLAVAAARRGDRGAAGEHLRRSIEETRRLATGSWVNIWGDPQRPLAFGLAEMAQLFDKASRAAYALQFLDAWEARPGVFFAEAQGFFERQLRRGDIERRTLQQRVAALAHQLVEADRDAQGLARDVNARDGHAQALAAQVRQQDAHAQALAAEVARQAAQAQELAAEVARRDARAQELAEEVRQQDARAQQLAQQIRDMDAAAQAVAVESARQREALEARARSLAAALESAEVRERELARALDVERRKTLWQRVRERLTEAGHE